MSQTKNNLHKVQYNTESTERECGNEQTEKYILTYPLNSVTYTPEDIINASGVSDLAEKWSR